MNCRNTASYRIAERLYHQMKLKREAAFHALGLKGGDEVVIPFDTLWSEEDAAAIQEFERLETEMEIAR